MEGFVLSRKDCRNVYLKIYFLIAQLVVVNFILAWVITYVGDISIWFDSYLSEDGKPQYTILSTIISLIPMVLIVLYNLFRKIGYVFKMSFINLLIIFLAFYTHYSMLQLGWKFILICFSGGLIALGILIFSGSTLKIKQHFNYDKMKIYLFALWLLYLLSLFLGNVATFVMNLVLFVFGLVLAFFETQTLRSKLSRVRNQQQLDNLLYPFTINIIGNFLLINFYFDSIKLFIKYFSLNEKD